MKIAGLQKLTLIDFPGRPAAIIFTQGCYFRCPYCHNPDLISIDSPAKLTEEEILNFLEKRKKILDGVCITGGEPTMHADLPEFILKIKDMGYAVKLDTNGGNPGMVEKIIKEGLADHFAMDIKTRWENYGMIARGAKDIGSLVRKCRETMAIIQGSGIDHEFRTTIFPAVHKKEDIFEIGGYLLDEENYWLQEIRYQKTLDRITDRPHLDVRAIAEEMRGYHPNITIGVR